MDDLTAVDDTILMDVGTVDAGMYHGIQEKYLILHVPTVMVEVVRQQATCI